MADTPRTQILASTLGHPLDIFVFLLFLDPSEFLPFSQFKNVFFFFSKVLFAFDILTIIFVIALLGGVVVGLSF